MDKPKFIYFDLGNVLLNFDHDLGCRQISEISGIHFDKVKSAIFGTELQTQYERGAISSREFFDQFCELTSASKEFKNNGFESMLAAASSIFSLNCAVVATVAQLRGQVFPMGILSNTCEAHWDDIVQNGFKIITDMFSLYALSHEIGAAKPDPKIYEKAQSLAGFDAKEIFFVDDRRENVEGALAAGWDAVRYTTASRLTDDLRRRGLKFNF